MKYNSNNQPKTTFLALEGASSRNQSDWTNFQEGYKIEVFIFATEAAPITF